MTVSHLTLDLLKDIMDLAFLYNFFLPSPILLYLIPCMTLWWIGSLCVELLPSNWEYSFYIHTVYGYHIVNNIQLSAMLCITTFAASFPVALWKGFSVTELFVHFVCAQECLVCFGVHCWMRLTGLLRWYLFYRCLAFRNCHRCFFCFVFLRRNVSQCNWSVFGQPASQWDV